MVTAQLFGEHRRKKTTTWMPIMQKWHTNSEAYVTAVQETGKSKATVCKHLQGRKDDDENDFRRQDAE